MKTGYWILAIITTALVAGGAVTILRPITGPVQAQERPAQVARDHRDKGWIGIHYEADPQGAWLINHVHVGSPAWNAGIMNGDALWAVEIVKDGKPLAREEYTTPVSIPYLSFGLATAAPGTTFRVLIKRGDNSKQLEKTFAIDFPREKLEVPAAQVMIDHIRRHAENWKQADWVWTDVTSVSFAEFATHETQRMQLDLMRLQIADLQRKARDADLERLKLHAEISSAWAQRDLAAAQAKTEELRRHEESNGGFSGFLDLALKLIPMLAGF